MRKIQGVRPWAVADAVAARARRDRRWRARALAGDGGQERRSGCARARSRAASTSTASSHASTLDKRADRIRDARCAAPGYRAAQPQPLPGAHPGARPSRARPARALRAPGLPPRPSGAVPAALAGAGGPRAEALVRGRGSRKLGPEPRQVDRPADQLRAASHREGAVVGVPGEGHPLRQRVAGLGPATRVPRVVARWTGPRPTSSTPPPTPASGATRRSIPTSGLPYNIWCAGQTLLRDGRVLVAGGNLSVLLDSDGLQVQRPLRRPDVQPVQRDLDRPGSDGATGAGTRPSPSSADGRVVDRRRPGRGQLRRREQQRRHRGLHAVARPERRRHDPEGRRPLLRPLPAHVPDAERQAAASIGPGQVDTAIIDPATWTVQRDPGLPSCGALGGRREWGAATLLPSGPAGPTTLLVQGGSDRREPAPDGSYGTAPATNTTLLVNLAAAADQPGPPNIQAAVT